MSAVRDSYDSELRKPSEELGLSSLGALMLPSEISNGIRFSR